jgi:bacillithiol biosynthesis deacetylase BshB1
MSGVAPRASAIAASAAVDVLAFGAHPDDVELGCAGTLASVADGGRRFGIVHLTVGESGTRGTPDQRRREAEAAAASLGASTLDILDCGDGALRTGTAEEDAVIALLRRHRPEIVLLPPPSDRHPDHGRAHELVRAAAFYAGLRKRGVGEPHRPAALFHYMQHDSFEPAFVVDVTSTWTRKLRALEAYTSQLHRMATAPGIPVAGIPVAGIPAAAAEPPTKVSSREFAAAVEGRARHFGQAIGVEFGEPFGSRGPLSIGDLWTLRPGGLR